MVESKEEPDIPSAPPQTKKRRRAPSSPSSRKKKAAEATSTTTQVVEPVKTLIIDNGGDTIKYGWSTDEKPNLLPNITARLKHQFTVLVGDELEQVQNPSSLYGVTRSTERGMIVNLGNQTLVWKRMMDKLGVAIPQSSEASNAFGWKVKSRKNSNVPTDTSTKIPSHTIAVLLLLPPHCPRLLLDQILHVWMEDFGVSRAGFGISSVFAAKEHSELKCSCTIDFGWSSTLVVPTFKQKPVQPSAIRRLPIGGRHMINMLKYYMSYRQYNLMDQEQILREVFERLGYLSLTFKEELNIAQCTPSGRRPYDRDYILPDHQKSHQGTVRLPAALQNELQRQQDSEKKNPDDDDEDDDDDDDDEDFNDEGSNESVEEGGENDDNRDDDDEEEETEAEKRKRLMKERAERERLRRSQEEEEQVLLVSVERFAVPEVLFRPQDAGLPADLVGIAQTVIQAIDSCPEVYHAALYGSIFMTGGVSRIPNLKTRLETELRTLASPDYTIHVELAESPICQAWMGAKSWTQDRSSMPWTVGQEDWGSASSKRKGIYSRLLLPNGGIYI
jgi:actin-related protein 6